MQIIVLDGGVAPFLRLGSPAMVSHRSKPRPDGKGAEAHRPLLVGATIGQNKSLKSFSFKNNHKYTPLISSD